MCISHYLAHVFCYTKTDVFPYHKTKTYICLVTYFINTLYALPLIQLWYKIARTLLATLKALNILTIFSVLTYIYKRRSGELGLYYISTNILNVCITYIMCFQCWQQSWWLDYAWANVIEKYSKINIKHAYTHIVTTEIVKKSRRCRCVSATIVINTKATTASLILV